MFEKSLSPYRRAAFSVLLPAALALGGVACAVGAQQSGSAAPAAPVSAKTAAPASGLRTGQAALGDWTTDAPGVRRKITRADLPKPYDTPSVDNGPKVVGRPDGALPKVPAGFTVAPFATGLENPRVIVTAPNGDLFVAESGPGRVKILRDANGDGTPEIVQVFSDQGLRRPFGVAFYPANNPNPTHVYVANTDGVVRFPYKNGDIKATTGPETVVASISGGGQLRGGGHWTRDIVFSNDSKTMYVSVGSLTNVNQENNPEEQRRARIFSFSPDGKNERVYASGIRNPVGLAVHPQTGQLWTSVNERDGLGDHLVPDYITSVKENGFYGWPWFYIGNHRDPRHANMPLEFKGKVIVPDVLLQSHSASLDLAFYTGRRFPRAYQNGVFAAEHGSWNRARRTGYKIVFVPLQNGRSSGEYQDFVTGFVTPEGDVWGRPVGVTTDKTGALLFTDDSGNTVWRVTYTGTSSGTRTATTR